MNKQEIMNDYLEYHKKRKQEKFLNQIKENRRCLILDLKKYFYKKYKEPIIKKQYYQNNKERLLEKAKKKFYCECCKCWIREDGVRRHNKTKKHLNLSN